MASTLRDVMDKVLMRASLEAGIDTNMYADDAVAQIVQSAFDTLFDKWWWPQFYNPGDTSFTLDGVTGTITSDISSKVSRYIDIRYVWLGTMPNPIPRAAQRLNPALIRNKSIAPLNDPTKVFMVLPVTTADSLTIAYRTKPDTFEGDDAVIDFDEELLVLASAYDYVNSLGLNPGAEDKLQQKYADRLSTILSELQQAEVQLGYDNQLPTDWNWF